MIRVVLVDDQALIRLGFRLFIGAEPDIEVVGEAGDGSAAVAVVAALVPDVVLMDVRMPGTDGIEATARITAASPASRVLILTTYDVDQYVFAGLRAGASGFLLKDTPPEELLSAIRTVAGGEAVLAPTATRRLIDRFVPLLPDPERQRRRAAVLAALTGREQSVFAELAAGALQPRDRDDALPLGGDRQTPCGAHPRQARPAGPRPGGRPGLRIRARHPGRLTGSPGSGRADPSRQRAVRRSGAHRARETAHRARKSCDPRVMNGHSSASDR